MPRKRNEGAPLQGEGQMSEETRRETFGGSDKEQGPRQGQPSNEDAPSRHSSGPSRSGSSTMPDHPRNT
jgi:hypothetical protein